MTTAFDPYSWPDRLNLGCGYDLRDGYLNVDLHAFHEPDVVADVTDLRILPDGHYAEIVAQDLLEHLPRTATPFVLGEWNRLLRPGGILTLRLPSVLDLVDMIAAEGPPTAARHERLVAFLFGTQTYTGDFHQTTFTEPLLRAMLDREGYAVRRWELVEGWLFDLDAEKVGPSETAERWAPFAVLLDEPDVDRFLHGVYDAILGRPADPAGLQHYRQQLETDAMTRRGVIVSLQDSDEARARS